MVTSKPLALAVTGLAALIACSLSSCSAGKGSPIEITGTEPPTRQATVAVSPTNRPVPTFEPDSTAARIVMKGKLTVGVKYDQPTFGYKDSATGAIDGFEIALAREVAIAMGLKADQVEFVEAISRDRIPFLQSDRVDLIIATMSITPDRQQQIDFSRPYYLAGQSILVKEANTTITGVGSLNGKKACSVVGSASEQNIAARAPEVNLLSLDAYAPCVAALQAGLVDAVSTDDVILAGFAAADPTLKLVGGQFTQEAYGIGIKKGKDDLVKFVDATIDRMLKDGTWDKLYDKYLGKVEGLPKAAEARARLPSTS